MQAGLLAALASQPEITRLRALVARPREALRHAIPSGVECVEVAPNGLPGTVADASGPAEVLHLTAFPHRAPWDLVAFALAEVSVLTVQDAIEAHHPEAFPDKAEYLWHLRAMRALVANATRLHTPSAVSAADAVATLGADPERIDVVANGLDPAFLAGPPAAPAPHAAGGRDLLVAVGPDVAHKDHVTLVRALARLGPGWRVDFVGPDPGPEAPRVTEARRLGVAERIRVREGLGDAALRGLLLGARALVFPSREEGFGLPPLEALALGVPALVADTRVAREVCGDAARYFPPGDAAALARRVADLPSRGAEAERARRRRHAARFSWERAAQGILQTYARALASPRPLDRATVVEAAALAAERPADVARELYDWQIRYDRLLRDFETLRDERDWMRRKLDRRRRRRWRPWARPASS